MRDGMKWYELFVLSSIEMICFFIIWSSLDDKLKKRNFEKGIIILLLSTMAVLLDRYNVSIGFIIIYSTMCVVLFLVFKVDMINTILEFFIAFGMIISIELLYTYIFSVYAGDLRYTFMEGVVINCTTLMSCYIVTRFSFLKKIQKIIFQYNKISAVVLINVIAVMMAVVYCWQLDKDLISQYTLIILIFVSIWVLINLYILLQKIKLKEREQQLNVHKRYLGFLESQIEDIRKQQHDYKNNLNVIYGLIEIEDSEIARKEIKKYTEKLIQTIQPTDKILSINDPILSAVIYSKKSMAESKDVFFTMQVKNRIPAYPLESHELVTVLGNLLDNAIEAAESSRGQVLLTLGTLEENRFIEIKNTGKGIEAKNPDVVFKKGYTTKDGKQHGYGLYNVKQVVERHNGTITLSDENGYVVFQVLL